MDRAPSSLLATVEVGGPTPVEALAGSSPHRLAVGARVGRYVVLSPVGAGGMGVVYAAFDPELDRKVALKLVRAATMALGSTPEQRERLLREAQAMARLSHPNVATVHDVGAHDDAVFIAMEFVEGHTLARWLEPGRTPAEILDVLLAAGRGLSAAHEAGLVHRDIKPDNVMVGPDGRVRVMDFGLARQHLAASSDERASGDMPARTHALHRSAGRLSHPLTQAGTLVGTPAYMAPEQLRGGDSDARADQFSFCVTAWEALYGERPFASGSVAELTLSVVEGRIREPPATRGVPMRVRRALERGLSPDPSKRWPTMVDLLAALSFDPRPRARHWLGGASIAVTAASVAILLTRPEPSTPCAVSDAKLAGVWDRDARVAVRRAFAKAATHGEQSFTLVAEGLDRYTGDWTDQHAASCRATHVVGDQSHAMMDLRTACLDDRLHAVAALVRVFSRADASTVEGAVDAVGELPSLEPCADPEYLAAAIEPPTDPQLAARVAEMRERLAEVTALNHAARHKDALALARTLHAEATDLDYAPLRAEILLQLGNASFVGDSPPDGIELVRAAFFLARAEGHDEVVRKAAIALVGLYGGTASELATTLEWAEHARAEVHRTGTPVDGAVIERQVGAAHRRAGDFESAEAHLRRAMDTLRQHVDPHHPALLATINSLGSVLQEAQRDEEAEALLRESLASFAASHGPDHPRVGSLAHNLGILLEGQGRYEEALGLHDRVLEVWKESIGVASSRYVSVRTSRALVLSRLGRHDEAIAELEAAKQTAIDLFGEDHELVGQIQGNLGVAHGEAGHHAASAEAYERALATFQRVHEDREHPIFAKLASNLGAAYERLGDREAARRHYRDALARFEARFGPSTPVLGVALTGLARIERDGGRPRDALVLAERALAVREDQAIAPADMASNRLLVARLRAQLGDIDGARALATEALSAAPPEIAQELRTLVAALGE